MGMALPTMLISYYQYREYDMDKKIRELRENEEDVEKKRRTVGRRKKKPVADPQEALDSYVPEGEWDVDAANIDMMDLLEDEPVRKITLSTISPATITPLGEEE